MPPTFVLVHGSGSNGTAWCAVQRELALLGHRSLAVDLPGHGFQARFSAAYQAPQDLEALAVEPSSSAGVRHEDAVRHVVATVERVAAHGPVILVGTSRGGLVLGGVGAAVPHLLDRLVYISAWCCVDHTVAEYAQGPEHAQSALAPDALDIVADPAKLGAVRINWRTADRDRLARLKTALFEDGTEAEFLAFLNTLEPDENLDTGGDAVRADAGTWGTVPRTYVRLTRDRAIPPALQDRFIREADALTPDNPFDVRELEASHVGFMVRAAETAALLADLARTPRTHAGSRNAEDRQAVG